SVALHDTEVAPLAAADLEHRAPHGHPSLQEVVLAGELRRCQHLFAGEVVVAVVPVPELAEQALLGVSGVVVSHGRTRLGVLASAPTRHRTRPATRDPTVAAGTAPAAGAVPTGNPPSR